MEKDLKKIPVIARFSGGRTSRAALDLINYRGLYFETELFQYSATAPTSFLRGVKLMHMAPGKNQGVCLYDFTYAEMMSRDKDVIEENWAEFQAADTRGHRCFVVQKAAEDVFHKRISIEIKMAQVALDDLLKKHKI